MSKATHNGTCQGCGRVQAVIPGRQTLADHGYKLAWNTQVGACCASRRQPMELDRSVTDATVAGYRAQADRLGAMTADDVHTVTVRTGGYRDRKDVDMDREAFVQHLLQTRWSEAAQDKATEWADAEWKRAVERTVYSLHGQARLMRSAAEQLEQLANERHGRPLYERTNDGAKALTHTQKLRRAAKAKHGHGRAGMVLQGKDGGVRVKLSVGRWGQTWVELSAAEVAEALS